MSEDDEAAVDEIRRRVTRDPGFAIAWALLQLAEAARGIERKLDLLGLNNDSPAGGPGTTEKIAMELKDGFAALADALRERER